MSSEGGLKSGGTISGDVTISGDLTVSGDSAANVSETITGDMTLTSSSSGGHPILTIEDTNAGSDSAIIKFVKDSASPNTGDKLMQIWAYGDNNAGEQTLYSEIATLPTSVTDGSEEGSMRFRAMASGTLTEAMRIRGKNIGIGTDSPDTLLHLYSTSASKPILKIENEQGGANPVSIQMLRNTSSPADDDFIGQIDFRSMNDAGTPEEILYAYISAQSTDISDGTEDGEMNFHTMKAGTATNTMTLQSGLVGIGTSSPAEELHIKGVASAYTILRIESGSTSHGSTIEFADATDANYGEILQFASSAGEGGRMRFTAGATETMNLRGGKVGIGVNNPTQMLHIASATDAFIQLERVDTSVADDDAIGAIIIRGGESSQTDVARIRVMADEDWTSSSSPTKMIFETTPSGATADAVALTIDSSQNATFAGIIEVASQIRHTGDTDNAIIFGTDIQEYYTGGSVRLKLDNSSRISLSNNGGEATNTIFGYQAGAAIHGSSGMNTFIGHQVADATMTATADENTAVGHLALSGLTQGYKNTVMGSYAGINITTGDENVMVGRSAGNAFNSNQVVAIGTMACGSITNANADGTVGVGHQSLTALTTGARNTALGFSSLSALTAGSNNIAIGYQAMDAADGTEQDNIAIGYGAMGAFDEGGNAGDSNIAIGRDALLSGSASDNIRYNIAIGNYALDATGTNHPEGIVAIGHQSLGSMTTGERNLAVGHLALQSITQGTANVAIGYQALQAMASTDGNDNNTAIGTYAMQAAGASSNVAANNTTVGFQSGYAITTADSSVIIGSNAGVAITTGNENTVMGSRALGTATTATNNVSIGGDSMYAVPAGQAVTGVVAIGLEAVKGSASTTTGIDGTVAVGKAALKSITAGAGNLAVGQDALTSQTTGTYSLAIGRGVLQHSVDGTGNIGIGYGVMADWDVGGSTNTTVDGSNNNIMIGVDAGGGAWTNVQSNYNIGIGNYVMDAAMDGALYNTAVGYNSSSSITTGDSNSTFGLDSGRNINSGSSNACFGHEAGNVITTGTNNTIIGQGSDPSANNSTNQIVIGSDETGYSDNFASIGGTVLGLNVPNTMASPYYRFDGTDDYIDCGNSSFLHITTLTICAWVKRDSTGAAAIFNGDSNSYAFYYNGSNNLGFGRVGVSEVTSNSTITDSLWHHVAVTYNGSNALFYIDGNLDVQQSYSDPTFSQTTKYIGKTAHGGGGSFLDGEISDVKVFNNVLTANEIKELHSGASVPYKYKDANHHIGDFSSGVDNWGGGASTVAGNIDSIGGQNDNLRMTVNTATSVHYTHWSNNGNWKVGKDVQISFDYYIPSGNSHLDSLSFGAYGPSTTMNTTDSWTSVSISFTVSQSYGFVIYGADGGVLSFTDSGGDDVFYIRNFKYYQLGAVVEYDGSGVTNTKWYDKSANAIHGTVSGATDENTAGAPVVSANHPAFYVTPASEQSNIAENSNVTIVFGTEVFDQGSNFASNTFTAPLTGKYQLNVNIRLDQVDEDADYYYVKLITSNREHRTIVATGAFDEDPSYHGFTISVLADMDASDTAYVAIFQQADGAVQSDVTTESNFSGYLVC